MANPKNPESGKVLTFFVFVFIGFILGFMSSVYLFAIEIDLLAVPYLNVGVETTEDLLATQNGRELSIPKGTQMLFTKRRPGSNEYQILINSYWDEEEVIRRIGSGPGFFEIKKNDCINQ